MTSKNKSKIGIIGIGYVGGVVKEWFQRNKYQLFLYDKYKNIGSIEEVNKAEIIFICLPTPYLPKKGYDDSAIFENLSKLKGKKIIVIKSTVLPGTTEKFQKLFPQHKILFNPEFLREKYALEDFFKPSLQLIGYTQKSKNVSKKILSLLPKAPYSKIVEAKIAELAKISVNNFLALKVTFANQIYDLTKKLKINYDDLREILENEPRLGKTHFDVFHGGYRGFGGKCLPKELKATLTLYKNLGLKAELFQTIDKINFNLLKNQGLLRKLKQDWLNNKS